MAYSISQRLFIKNDDDVSRESNNSCLKDSGGSLFKRTVFMDDLKDDLILEKSLSTQQ